MNRIIAIAALVAGPIAAFCLADEQQKAAPASLAVEVVDAAGQPVAGADVGFGATMFLRKADATADEALKWTMRGISARSNSAGLASVPLAEGDRWRVEGFCLTGRQAARRLAGVAIIGPEQLGKPLRLTLVEERTIEGTVTCPELAERHMTPSGGLRVDVKNAGKIVLSYHSGWPKVRFALPPGDYELEVDGQTDTHAVKQALHVEATQGALDLGTIKLPASNMALLVGQTAPEIPGVIAWKNGSPGTLEELRGKVVLLDFWGYWCGACISTMPKLFALHDKYRDRGLVIIGIHSDVRTHDQPPVNTPAEMDALVAEFRQDLWRGRDIPYSVALVPAEMLKHRGGMIENRALSQASEVYGVWSYPTYVLIDRQGKVAGQLRMHDEEGTKLLEKLLAEK
ncbi:MAG TPA: TlpA disulfide reductase family protein [Pirellulales bacterium]|nr:TlpA disulfide reductase family protein [Pirellulales bacterium]